MEHKSCSTGLRGGRAELGDRSVREGVRPEAVPALVTAERPLQRTFGAGQSPVVDHPRLALREWSRGSSSIKIGSVHGFSLIQTWNKSSVISL